MAVLRIPDIPQYGVLVETKYGKDTSLFHNVYSGALMNVYNIIIGNRELREVKRDKLSSKELHLNPIIAFVGDRGTGKSSAMSSVAKLLDENTSDTSYDWFIPNHPSASVDDIRKTIRNSKFFILPAIDSAQMGTNETIIGNVSAGMFREFSRIDKNMNLKVDEKRNFIHQAKTVNEISVMFRNGKWFERSDKLLSDTEKIGNMHKEMQDLVTSFLKIAVSEYSKENTYLVIQIDDLDMSIKGSYSIIEEIRRFLSIENVIILTSLQIKQLECLLEAEFRRTLDDKEDHNHSWLIKDLSFRHIEKLIPTNRRHHMPEIDTTQLRNTASSNFLNDDDKSWERIGLKKSGDMTSGAPSVLNAILHLIWRKTMIIPVCDEFQNHMIIPRNLRSLCNFIVFLRNLDDVAFKNDSEYKVNGYKDFESDHKLRETVNKNLNRFARYLIENLSSYGVCHMNEEDEALSCVLTDVINMIMDVPLTQMNAKIVGKILYHISKHDHGRNTDMYKAIFEDYSETLFKNTLYPDTISMGDVMYVLGKLDKKTHCDYIKYLVEVIRTLWSVRMTRELYVNGCNEKHPDRQPKNPKITNDFRKAVGGFMINPDKTKFCYEKTGKHNKSDDWEIISVDDFMKDYNTDYVRPLYAVFATDSEGDNGKCKLSSDGSVVTWRSHLDEGNAYYEYETKHNLVNKDLILFNPMALFTNILSPSIVKNKLLIEGYKDFASENMDKWYQDHIMVFPFYSMDFMYRLYEIFHKNSRLASCYTQIESPLIHLMENAEKSVNHMCSIADQYLPLADSESVSTNILKAPVMLLSKIIIKLSFKNSIKKIIVYINDKINGLERGLEDHQYIELAVKFHKTILEAYKIKDNEMYNTLMENFNNVLVKDYDTLVNALNTLKGQLENLIADKDDQKK